MMFQRNFCVQRGVRLWAVCAILGLGLLMTVQGFLPFETFSARSSRSAVTSGKQLALFKTEEVPLEADDSRPALKAALQPQNVQFVAPLLDYGYPPTVEEFRNGTLEEKPVLLYLPGFDGTYICPFLQFPELGTEFEVWCMTVGMNDRSTFQELKAHVLDFIEGIASPTATTGAESKPGTQGQHVAGKITRTSNITTAGAGPFWSGWFSGGPGGTARTPTKGPKRQIYLAGESFGGILASEVALQLLSDKQNAIDLTGLVLINPATCYDRSQLAAKGPSVYNLPALLYPFGLAQLLPLLTDEYSVEQLLLILQAKALPSIIDTPAREAYMGRVAFSLPMKLEYMNQGTLEWRLTEWLEVGCERMESRMAEFQEFASFRTLILAGEKDLTLPSIAEAERLINLLPRCQVHVVEGAGHASTCGSRMDMAAQLRKAFPELQKSKFAKTAAAATTKTTIDKNRAARRSKRTAMKPQAAEGTGSNLGMEPRYDGASIGLNPILYWSKGNFQAVKRLEDQQYVTGDTGNESARFYRKACYELKDQ